MACVAVSAPKPATAASGKLMAPVSCVRPHDQSARRRSVLATRINRFRERQRRAKPTWGRGKKAVRLRTERRAGIFASLLPRDQCYAFWKIFKTNVSTVGNRLDFQQPRRTRAAVASFCVPRISWSKFYVHFLGGTVGNESMRVCYPFVVYASFGFDVREPLGGK